MPAAQRAKEQVDGAKLSDTGTLSVSPVTSLISIRVSAESATVPCAGLAIDSGQSGGTGVSRPSDVKPTSQD